MSLAGPGFSSSSVSKDAVPAPKTDSSSVIAFGRALATWTLASAMSMERAQHRLALVLAVALGLLAMPVGAAAKQGFEVRSAACGRPSRSRGATASAAPISTKGHKQVTLGLPRGGEVNGAAHHRPGQPSRDLGEVRGPRRRSRSGFKGRTRSADSMPRQRERSGDSAPGCSGRDADRRTRCLSAAPSTSAARTTSPGSRRIGLPAWSSGVSGGSAGNLHAKNTAPRSKKLLGGVRLTQLEARARISGVNVTFEATAIDFNSILGPGLPLYLRILRTGGGTARRHASGARRPADRETTTVSWPANPARPLRP